MALRRTFFSTVGVIPPVTLLLGDPDHVVSLRGFTKELMDTSVMS